MFLESTVGCKRLSTDESFALIFNLCGTLPQPRELQINNFVVVAIERKKFIGLITDINEDEGEAELSLLSPNVPSSTFRWPDDLMTYIAPLPDILTLVYLEELPENKYQPTFEGKIQLATVLKSGLKCN